MELRDSLLTALSKLPGTRDFHLHLLVSAPRKYADLYPYITPRPRTALQDILILLSEQPTPDAPRVFVAAIEAYVYVIPSTASAIMYIAKVDSTGQGLFPSPVSTLVKALVGFYVDPDLTTRDKKGVLPRWVQNIWVHVFARAQNQYLFPNSVEWAGKAVLSDVKLCSWWKRILGEVAAEVEGRKGLAAPAEQITATGPSAETQKTTVRLHYILPGYNELEAIQSLHDRSSPSAPQDPTASTTPISWIYGHPYSQGDDGVPLPGPFSGASQQRPRHLGEVIPYFDDDPKSRFLDEIAYTDTQPAGGAKSSERKRARKGSVKDGLDAEIKGDDDLEAKGDSDRAPPPKVMGELAQVSADEFWERMSFRQECVAGAVTGFFTLIIHTNATTNDKVSTAPTSALASSTELVSSALAPRSGQVSAQIVKRVMTLLTTSVEFSTLERSVRGTEAAEGLIKGLCEGLTLPMSGGGRIRPPVSRDQQRREQKTPEPGSSSSAPMYLAPPRTPPPSKGRAVGKDSISPNPFDEPELTLNTYHSYIYGKVMVRNPEAVRKKDLGKKEEIVQVLAVRKKKK
ncbi:histone acetylation protein-domain-containing protein [Pterulicium gracile]|uniref:histone acetyltransferase n=1 Tax=Pterulicium gracile TaxID=1884261 RepID=A0A5C3QL40_9AGAR|nr:histone acetylation protein-domain-containing protein [Pterula gracilis]